MILVPYSTVCLASIIASYAIKDDAFEPSFESVEAQLYPVQHDTGIPGQLPDQAGP